MAKRCRQQPAGLRPEIGASRWHLRLYIAGSRGRSDVALMNLKKFCAERLRGNCLVEVIDLLENPARAKSDHIVAIPTLVRAGPGPMRRVLGDLSNLERVLGGLKLI